MGHLAQNEGEKALELNGTVYILRALASESP